VFVPLVVMTELSWVLRGAKWERWRAAKTSTSVISLSCLVP
jgi:hypothetical protein